MIKIAIVDDQNLMTEGLKIILNQYEDIEVVTVGENGHDAVEICRKYSIDVLLLDIRMPELNGVEAVKEIRRFNKDMKILMLTTFDDDDYIVEAIGHGASGYLFKDIEYEKLVDSIREVHQGKYILSTKVAQILARKVINQEKRNDEIKNYNLTTRELEIIELMKDGFNNKQIARALYISEGTVKNYISTIYNKIGINDRQSFIDFIKNKI